MPINDLLLTEFDEEVKKTRTTLDADRYRALRAEELALLGGRSTRHLADATQLLDDLVLRDEFAEFLTLGAYPLLDRVS